MEGKDFALDLRGIQLNSVRIYWLPTVPETMGLRMIKKNPKIAHRIGENIIFANCISFLRLF